MLRWPDEADRLPALRAKDQPRLLLVEPNSEPPAVAGCLEDWVRLPATDPDVRARVDALLARADAHRVVPGVDEDGLLRYRDGWVALSPVETCLAAALSDRFGAVVGREALARRAWPDGLPTRNALDVHVLRLRRRIAELGLEVRTVRGRGYVLQPCTENGEVRRAG